jgi:hypothetical protein
MRIQTLLTLLLAVTLLAVAAAAKKPSGKISDLAAFSRIHSYCVDSSSLPGDEALDLNGFMSGESKPKKLLSKLPWTRTADCSDGSPDVTIRVEFSKNSGQWSSAGGVLQSQSRVAGVAGRVIASALRS